MKNSLLLPLALFALLAPSAALAKRNSGTSSGPTIIPGGVVTITYVINKPGSYVLGSDRMMNASLNNIEIAAHDVTLDLGGFALSHPDVPVNPYSAIHVARNK